MLQSGEEPAWPLKVGLRELPLALSAAHDFGKLRSDYPLLAKHVKKIGSGR